MRNKKFYNILLVLAFFNFLFLGCKGKKEEENPAIEIVSPRMGNLMIKVLATGTITPYRRIEIKSSDRGRVEKIYFDEGNKIAKGQTLALISTLDRIALIDTARANIYKAEKSGDEKLIEEAKNELAVAEKAYNPVPIIAPVSGEIINRSIETGEHVSMEKVLFVISDRLILRIQVDEADIGKIKKNQIIKFYLDTFPDEIHTARVKRISREGRLVSNVMEYEVLGFPGKVLKKWISGMTVNAEFIISEKKNILLLPVDAVKKIKNKSFVIAMSNNSRVLKKIEAGISDYKDIEVIRGVGEEDRILLLSQKEFGELFGSFMKKGFKGGTKGKPKGDGMRRMRRMMR